MTKFMHPKKNIGPQKGLPQNPDMALREMIQISSSLINLSERETQTLAQNDFMSFTILQDEKEVITTRYQAASEAFRARLEDFRKADRSLLQRLESMQQRLHEVAKENTALVKNMRDRAQKTTQKTLLTVQELGQARNVSFPANTGLQEERI